VIVNGGSYGIEGMALRSSLAVGGSQIVIMGGGVARRAQLLERFAGAIPGSTTNAANRGCHELIQAGAARLMTRALAR